MIVIYLTYLWTSWFNFQKWNLSFKKKKKLRQKLFHEALTWFNNKHKVNFTPSKLQFLYEDYDPPLNTNSNITRKFQILTVETWNIATHVKC